MPNIAAAAVVLPGTGTQIVGQERRWSRVCEAHSEVEIVVVFVPVGAAVVVVLVPAVAAAAGFASAAEYSCS